jgi:hypothetical protein
MHDEETMKNYASRIGYSAFSRPGRYSYYYPKDSSLEGFFGRDRIEIRFGKIFT